MDFECIKIKKKLKHKIIQELCTISENNLTDLLQKLEELLTYVNPHDNTGGEVQLMTKR